jgi:hypothetical protein
MSKTYLLALSLSVSGLFSTACRHDKDPIPTPVTPEASTLKAENVSPAASTKLSESSILSADLTYALAEQQKSDYGFDVFAQFESTTPGKTIGPGYHMAATNRSGKITYSVPMSAIWNNRELKHPVTAYFYLVNKTTNTGTSTVIAKVGPYTYTE